MKTRHKWLVAIGLLIAVVGWLAWTLLTAESDVAPQSNLGSSIVAKALG